MAETGVLTGICRFCRREVCFNEVTRRWESDDGLLDMCDNRTKAKNSTISDLIHLPKFPVDEV